MERIVELVETIFEEILHLMVPKDWELQNNWLFVRLWFVMAFVEWPLILGAQSNLAALEEMGRWFLGAWVITIIIFIYINVYNWIKFKWNHLNTLRCILTLLLATAILAFVGSEFGEYDFQLVFSIYVSHISTVIGYFVGKDLEMHDEASLVTRFFRQVP